MESPLLVFISSVLNAQSDDLAEERRSAEVAINSLYLSRSWRFESAPPPSDPLETSYLNKGREGDIFILILSRAITEAVRHEYYEATYAKRPRLVFVKRAGTLARSKELTEFIEKEIAVKYRDFDPGQFETIVKEAVADEVIRAYRAHLDQPDLGRLLNVIHEASSRQIVLDYALSTFRRLRRSAPRSPLEL